MCVFNTGRLIADPNPAILKPFDHTEIFASLFAVLAE
jgi:hypothetical protein